MRNILVEPELVDLQLTILDHLAEPSIHGLLPLLGVNRHLRQLVINRVFALFSREGTPSTDPINAPLLKPRLGDGFIKICQRDYPAWGSKPTSPDYDPRRLFSSPEHDLIRCHGWNKERGVEHELFLHLVEHDPITQICTFEPVDRVNHLLFGYPFCFTVDPINGRPLSECWANPVLQAASSHWFRPALDGKNSYYGLQLAARPDLQPSCMPALWPRVHDERGKTIVKKEARFANGWKATCETWRLDRPREPRDAGWSTGGAEDLNVRLVFVSLEVPFIDLLCPPQTAEDDLKDDYYVECLSISTDLTDWLGRGNLAAAERRLADDCAARGGLI